MLLARSQGGDRQEGQEAGQDEGFAGLEEFMEYWEKEIGPSDPEIVVWVYEFRLSREVAP